MDGTDRMDAIDGMDNESDRLSDIPSEFDGAPSYDDLRDPSLNESPVDMDTLHAIGQSTESTKLISVEPKKKRGGGSKKGPAREKKVIEI